MRKTFWAMTGLILLATVSCREADENVNFSTQEEQTTKKEIMKRGGNIEEDSINLVETQPEYPPKK